jgi:hypothetical protein
VRRELFPIGSIEKFLHGLYNKIFYVYFIHNEKVYYINIVVIGSDGSRRKTKVQN